MNAAASKEWLLNHIDMAVAIVISILYAIIRWVSLSGVPPLQYGDSKRYIALFQDGIPEQVFTGVRSWGYPAFIWLFGHNLELVIMVQRFLGIAGWLMLAWSLMIHFQSIVARLTSFVLLLAISLSFAFIQWDPCVLTESLTLSLLAMSISLIIFVRCGGEWSPILVIPLIAILTFLAGLRDANIFMLPLFAGVLLLGYLPSSITRWKERGSKRDWLHITWPSATAVAILLIAGLHFHWATKANRGWQTTANAITIRAFLEVSKDQVSYDQENIDLFQTAYGAPPAISQRAAKSIYDPPELGPKINAWFENEAPAAWKNFLLSNPSWVWNLYTNYPTPYSQPYEPYFLEKQTDWGDGKPAIPGTIETFLNATIGGFLDWWRFHLILVIAGIAAAFVWQSSSWKRLERTRIARIEIIFLLTSISAVMPLMALVGDAIEDWRHALAGLAALYMVLPILAAWGVDVAITQLAHRRQTSASAGEVTSEPNEPPTRPRKRSRRKR